VALLGEQFGDVSFDDVERSVWCAGGSHVDRRSTSSGACGAEQRGVGGGEEEEGSEQEEQDVGTG